MHSLDLAKKELQSAGRVLVVVVGSRARVTDSGKPTVSKRGAAAQTPTALPTQEYAGGYDAPRVVADFYDAVRREATSRGSVIGKEAVMPVDRVVPLQRRRARTTHR